MSAVLQGKGSRKHSPSAAILWMRGRLREIRRHLEQTLTGQGQHVEQLLALLRATLDRGSRGLRAQLDGAAKAYSDLLIGIARAAWWILRSPLATWDQVLVLLARSEVWNAALHLLQDFAIQGDWRQNKLE